MGTFPTVTKYVIRAEITIDGVVEKPDVVGAIFGQTEGLLGEELDLRELQRTGRIGRIRVNLNSKGGKVTGEIIIPSSLNRVETSIIAAAIEEVNRVGPCRASVRLIKVEDVRVERRKKIIERAIEILKNWEEEVAPSSKEIIEAVIEGVKTGKITTIGPEKITAGPLVKDSEEIIVVEGRADVINLVKNGFENVVAVEGTKIPQTIIDLCSKKTATAFMDGDRGGELILRELLQVAEIDYVARAPEGREVEELTRKEIIKALTNRIPADAYIKELEEEKKPELEEAKGLEQHVSQLKRTLKARLLDKDLNVKSEVEVKDLPEVMKDYNAGEIYAVVFDGIVTQRIVDLAGSKDIKILVGERLGSIEKKPYGLKILTFTDFERER